MRSLKLFFITFFMLSKVSFSQIPLDFLSKEFHTNRRALLRTKMPKNTVAVVFANPIRNRANDVNYVFHQDPNFYYLTGYREPNGVVLIFSEAQVDANGTTYNEILFVQKKDALAELWNGKRLGVANAKEKLGFKKVLPLEEFLTTMINYKKFDAIYIDGKFKNDYRNVKGIDVFDVVTHFKKQTTFTTDKNTTVNTVFLKKALAAMREIKTPEELKLLTKAIRISAIGQIEVMKAIEPNMSETELQGIHEFVYKKYGAEYEGYPSIVGSGNNGCILHYIDNNKPKINNELVLMDLGAEYRGYTADVTRTIPANGTFTPEQKAIYNIVYKAQEAGIQICKEGTTFSQLNATCFKVINEGLYALGITKSLTERHNYLPHGVSHYIGLDVHDLGTYTKFKANSVITVEPGIYIPEGSNCDKKWWGIAVRIEDDILITKNNPINLSAAAPRKLEEIEKMTKKQSILNKFVLPNLDK